MKNSLTGKVVLISGANGGIGRALVAAFADVGADVIAGARTAQPIEGAGKIIALDVTSDMSVADASRAIGPVDILVNNAGVNANRRLFSPECLADAAAEMDVNYFGLLRLTQAFAPAMRERRSGVVANMLSILGHVNLPLSASYCASKAAALSLTQALRAELSPYGIQVCGVFPSAVDTRMTANSKMPKSTPDEVAAALLSAIREGSTDVFIGQARDIYARLRQDPGAVEVAMASRLPLPAA